MAMNKKEREQLETITERARINRALRWSDYDKSPDVPIPSYSTEVAYVNGWSINTYDRGRVYKSWSSSNSHGDGWVIKGKRPDAPSQKGIRQYSTKEKALKALRAEMEERFASKLSDIDAMINEALNADENS